MDLSLAGESKWLQGKLFLPSSPFLLLLTGVKYVSNNRDRTEERTDPKKFFLGVNGE